MKKWMTALAFGCLIVSFQNCSKTNFSSDAGSNAQSLNQVNPATEDPVTSLKPDEAQAILLPNTPVLDAQLQSTQSKAADANPFDSNSLSLNPKTGVINVLSADGSADPDQLFCLSSEQIAQLEGLLNTARICAGEDLSANQDMACQLDYRFPYAKLQFTGQDVTLGERFSGCHTGTDLCGEGSKALQNFLAGLVTNLKNQACHFQDL